jgi:hypothetical protein
LIRRAGLYCDGRLDRGGLLGGDLVTARPARTGRRMKRRLTPGTLSKAFHVMLRYRHIHRSTWQGMCRAISGRSVRTCGIWLQNGRRALQDQSLKKITRRRCASVRPRRGTWRQRITVLHTRSWPLRPCCPSPCTSRLAEMGTTAASSESSRRDRRYATP